MTTDEKLRLARVPRTAAHSGEGRLIDKQIEILFRQLHELAPGNGDAATEHDWEFKL